ncbi:MAG: DNA-binding protein [Pseudolabrys sp.]
MDQPNTPSTARPEHECHGQDSIAGDILHGAEEIAEFLYGDARHRRRVYNLIDGSRLPHFRLGAGICARRSILLAWIASQENIGG